MRVCVWIGVWIGVGMGMGMGKRLLGCAPAYAAEYGEAEVEGGVGDAHGLDEEGGHQVGQDGRRLHEREEDTDLEGSRVVGMFVNDGEGK